MAAAVPALARDGGVGGSGLRTIRLLIVSLLFLATVADDGEDVPNVELLIQTLEAEMEAFKKSATLEHARLTELIYENELVINSTLEKIERYPMCAEQTKLIKVKVQETVVTNNNLKDKLYRMYKTYTKGIKYFTEKIEMHKAMFLYQKMLHEEL